MKPYLTILLLLSLFARPLTAQKNWELKKEQDGIRICSRPGDNRRVNDVKVEMVLPARLSSLAALILDIGNYPNWSFSTDKSYVLKKISPSELYFYSLIQSPWPVSNRDLTIHLHLTQDSATRVLSIHADEIANLIPEKKGIIRVPVSIERWIVTPLAGDKIKINYELNLDPGASVPGWLINMFATKGPFETFSHLREQIQKPRYRDAILPFIRD